MYNFDEYIYVDEVRTSIKLNRNYWYIFQNTKLWMSNKMMLIFQNLVQNSWDFWYQLLKVLDVFWWNFGKIARKFRRNLKKNLRKISLNFSYFFEISRNFFHNLFKTPRVFQNIFSKFSLLKFVWILRENAMNVQRLYPEFLINFSEISEQFTTFRRNV